ncbi:hypothetical protein GN956_G27111, partial [Arapaima gigas]
MTERDALLIPHVVVLLLSAAAGRAADLHHDKATVTKPEEKKHSATYICACWVSHSGAESPHYLEKTYSNRT